MGVIDFAAERVRYFDSGERACCVFDTPYHPDRPSHADIVFAAGHQPQDEEDARKVKEAIFNRIGGTRAFTKSSDVNDCDLSPFLPQRSSQQPDGTRRCVCVHRTKRSLADG